MKVRCTALLEDKVRDICMKLRYKLIRVHVTIDCFLQKKGGHIFKYIHFCRISILGDWVTILKFPKTTVVALRFVTVDTDNKPSYHACYKRSNNSYR
jgi:hypothetical protein